MIELLYKLIYIVISNDNVQKSYTSSELNIQL